MKLIFLKIKQSLIRTIKGERRSILHFFLAFTGLFLILTAIILRVSYVGMYSSTDQELRAQASDPVGAIARATSSISYELPSDDNSSKGRPPFREFGSFVVLYDSDGTVLNYDRDSMAAALKTAGTKMNQNFVGEIGLTHLESEPYRTLIIPFSAQQFISNGGKVAYIQFFQSVGQIQDGVASTTRTIRITMFAFWFLSLFVSIYLSRVSQRPLEIALERQKAFVSNASHELRTPLAIMQNRLQLLFQHPNATIIDESENISASLNEVRNMRVLTGTLLDMAKSDGSVNIQPSETDETFFKEIFENFEILAEQHGKIFTSSIKFEESAQLDQSLIKQVLTILFDNASKYTRSAGEIHAEVLKQRNELQLIVTDNGPGISNHDKKKIFDRFYRVDEARTRGKGGLGLGLSLANEIVRAMKGKITVEDNKPQGTTFIVKLKL
ncbi:MAG: HAMP domain-containing histidine kinase [Streptococcaceae bacterium]|jgi:two-component system sensor histidine kinase CiaH|nr:HAMP domain-containing histidine kinase [Streptococcaceae bacterium]